MAGKSTNESGKIGITTCEGMPLLSAVRKGNTAEYTDSLSLLIRRTQVG